MRKASAVEPYPRISACGVAPRVFVAARERSQTIEARDAQDVQHGVRAAGDHDVGLAAAENADGFSHGLR